MLEGRVERYTADEISGWALDTQTPQEPQFVDIRIDGVLMARLRASLPRADGHACGFCYRLPPGLRYAHPRPLVEVVFSRDGTPLANAPRHLRLNHANRRLLVLSPAGVRHGIDTIRWYEKPQEEMIRAYYNVGDMIVYDSTLKLLSFADVAVANIVNPTDRDLDMYNAEFDCAVLRGSNYINESMQWQGLDVFLRRLKLPVLCFGVGAQAETARKLNLPEKSREIWRLFADHCATIGVRGTYSAEVLNDLGIRNVEVIGCPSLFRHNNPYLRLTPPPFEAIRRVAFTLRREVSPAYSADVARYLSLHKKLIRQLNERFDLTIMTHGEREEKAFFFKNAKLMEEYEAALVKSGWFDAEYPELRELYRSRLFFSNAVADYDLVTRSQDLVLGFRVHGNLTALANGTPAIFVDYDIRSRELAESLAVPQVSLDALDRRPLSEIYAPELFDDFNRSYLPNYRRMAAFLDRNGYRHNLHAV